MSSRKLHFDRVLVLDGAFGTMLQQAGLKPGDCPERWNLERVDAVKDIHRVYIDAGADIIQTNTFGANRFKLGEYGLADRVAEINQAAVKLAREAAGGRALVALDIGPTGRMALPFGDLDFDRFYEAFAEQVRAAAAAGADLISIETMSDLTEVRAAVVAARENSTLPVLAEMTFGQGARTMMGTDPETAAVVLDALGADVIGANCFGGPAQLLEVIGRMRAVTARPLVVQPNAGLPRLVDGRTVYPETPAGMAGYIPGLVEAGAAIVGGCCGTTPDHIRAIKEAARGLKPVAAGRRPAALAGRSRAVVIGRDPAVMGEIPGPDPRPDLVEDIRSGRMAKLFDEAAKQVENGASVIGINVDVPGVDQAEAVTLALAQIQAAADYPVAIDSAQPAVIEAGLKAFQGKALVCAGGGQAGELVRLLPLARKYGAAVLIPTRDEGGVPPGAGGRIALARRIVAQALDHGFPREDLFIDCVAEGGNRTPEALQALRAVKEELGVATALRVSDVSRDSSRPELLAATCLAMALALGLDLPILNLPGPLVREVLAAGGMLAGKAWGARAWAGLTGGPE
jgi:5-methyltetrahydrofolate--homocysteine methyltransferase